MFKKKILSCWPHIQYYWNQVIIDFLVKSNFFNDYFSQQYTTVNNDSSSLPKITFTTEQKLSTFEFCTDDIVTIIKSLDRNKAHGHDEMSVRIIKIWASSILFRNCFENQCFPKERRKSSIVPVHEKMINNWLKITDQYHYCLFLVKWLKK